MSGVTSWYQQKYPERINSLLSGWGGYGRNFSFHIGAKAGPLMVVGGFLKKINAPVFGRRIDCLEFLITQVFADDFIIGAIFF
jgi:hypothetical protein